MNGATTDSEVIHDEASGDHALGAHLRELELMLLEPRVRASAAQLDELIADDFREIAASGRTFGKNEVLTRLPLETGVVFRTEALEVRTVAQGVVLLVYRACREADGEKRLSRRSSLWRQDANGWRMVFHQGTDLRADASDNPEGPPAP